MNSLLISDEAFEAIQALRKDYEELREVLVQYMETKPNKSQEESDCVQWFLESLRGY